MTEREVPLEGELLDDRAPLAVRDEALPARRVSADAMLESYREYRRYTRELLGHDWGYDEHGRLTPTAEDVNKVALGARISFQTLSRDANGDPGVIRAVLDAVDARGNLRKMVKFTCTVRATDMFGRDVDITASCDSTETKHNQSEHKMEQVAQTRARKKAALVLVGGVDADEPDARGSDREYASAKVAENGNGLAPTAQALLRRAIDLRLCKDGPEFVRWAREQVRGCSGIGGRKELTVVQRRAIESALNELAASEAADAEIADDSVPSGAEDAVPVDARLERASKRYFALCGELGWDDKHRHDFQAVQFPKKKSTTTWELEDFVKAIDILEMRLKARQNAGGTR